jgi:hypothetical protein
MQSGNSGPEWLSLLRHEVRHVQQNHHAGGRYRFGIEYLGGMVVAIFHGGSPPGEKNPMEAPHYEEMRKGYGKVVKEFNAAVQSGACP